MLEPVQTEVLEREADAVVLNIVAKKMKGEECRLIRVYAYGIDGTGTHSLATVRRVDGSPNQGITHAAGTHDFGAWRIKPTSPETVRVQVYVEHNCLGRVIKSKLAEAAL